MRGDRNNKVAITGADGRIGSVLTKRLNDFRITEFGAATNLNDPESLADQLRGHHALIHMAWIDAPGPPTESSVYTDVVPTDNRHLKNLQMTANVLEAAQQANVRRVVLASSIHVDDYRTPSDWRLITARRQPRPTSAYGAAKLLVEEQGLHYSRQGMEIACIRIGAVTADGKAEQNDHYERRVWLSRSDLTRLVRMILEAADIPGNFCVMYAVSDNEGRVHDLTNPFGWQPHDRAAAPTNHETVSFTDLVDVTDEDNALIKRTALEFNAGTADRMLQLLTSLRNRPSSYQIDGYQHCLQTATRALRDGANEEQIVCALMHDVATFISTENHAAVAAEILRPYVSRANYWTVAHHGEFQLYLRNSDRKSRAKYEGHPFADQAAQFCTQWDQKSFDPDYDTLTIDVFVPLVHRVFARTPYAVESSQS